MSWRRCGWRASVLALAVGLTACGDATPAARPPMAAPLDTRWTDAFDGLPDLFVVLHPRALARDPLFGPLLHRISELAAERAPAITGTRAVDVLEQSDEVLLGVRTSEDGPSEATIVLRGVPAENDPGRVLGTDGSPLFRAVSERSRIAEFAHGGDVSLFSLPGRTWIIAAGESRARIRDNLGQPTARPSFKYDARSPIVLRIDGARLVERTRKLRDGGELSALGHHLASLSLSLGIGKDAALLASFAYADEDAAAVAEVTANRVVTVVKRSDTSKLKWLASAEVDRQDPKVLTVRVRLPDAVVKNLVQSQGLPGMSEISPKVE